MLVYIHIYIGVCRCVCNIECTHLESTGDLSGTPEFNDDLLVEQQSDEVEWLVGCCGHVVL